MVQDKGKHNLSDVSSIRKTSNKGKLSMEKECINFWSFWKFLMEFVEGLYGYLNFELVPLQIHRYLKGNSPTSW